MMLYDEQGTAIRADRCQRPRSLSNNRGGRTWDAIPVYVDAVKVDVWLDTTWGWYGYFTMAGKWYKARLDDQGEWKKNARKGMMPERHRRYTTKKPDVLAQMADSLGITLEGLGEKLSKAVEANQDKLSTLE